MLGHSVNNVRESFATPQLLAVVAGAFAIHLLHLVEEEEEELYGSSSWCNTFSGVLLRRWRRRLRSLLLLLLHYYGAEPRRAAEIISAAVERVMAVWFSNLETIEASRQPPGVSFAGAGLYLHDT